MIDPRTLRGQLALAYAAALLVALIGFAGGTLLVADRTQRSSLDDRLQTATRAITAIAEVRGGRVVLDIRDRAQFASVVGNRLDAAVFDARVRPLATTQVSIPQPILRLARAGGDQQRLATVDAANDTLRVVVTPVMFGTVREGVVLVWRDLDAIEYLDRRLALLFGFAIPAVAVFAVLAGSAVAARGLRPLETMATVASEIEARDLSRRLAIPPRNDELGRLCATFDRMLDRLEDAFARQRRFTSDASHELRAPLSVIRAEADLTLRRPRSTEEYERALRAIVAQAEDLELLTRDLLAAARAEASLPSNEIVDAGTLAREAANRIAPLARSRRIHLDVASDGEVEVRADAASLHRGIGCLLYNALHYAREGGTVAMCVQRAGEVVRLEVADDGPGFSEAALVHATERFWRDESGRSQRAHGEASSGAGLGLAIARAIVEAAGGSLRLANRPQGGAVVVLEIPVTPTAAQPPPDGASSS